MAAGATLQIADAPGAHARLLGQLLLRKPRCQAVLAEQLGKDREVGGAVDGHALALGTRRNVRTRLCQDVSILETGSHPRNHPRKHALRA
jgi:hypothetical protein